MNLLEKITLAWTQYRAFQAALAELNRHSDRKLGELGITRADLPRIAYAQAERYVEMLAARCPASEPSARRQEPEARAA